MRSAPVPLAVISSDVPVAIISDIDETLINLNRTLSQLLSGEPCSLQLNSDLMQLMRQTDTRILATHKTIYYLRKYLQSIAGTVLGCGELTPTALMNPDIPKDGITELARLMRSLCLTTIRNQLAKAGITAEICLYSDVCGVGDTNRWFAGRLGETFALLETFETDLLKPNTLYELPEEFLQVIAAMPESLQDRQMQIFLEAEAIRNPESKPYTIYNEHLYHIEKNTIDGDGRLPICLVKEPAPESPEACSDQLKSDVEILKQILRFNVEGYSYEEDETQVRVTGKRDQIRLVSDVLNERGVPLALFIDDDTNNVVSDDERNHGIDTEVGNLRLVGAVLTNRYVGNEAERPEIRINNTGDSIPLYLPEDVISRVRRATEETTMQEGSAKSVDDVIEDHPHAELIQAINAYVDGNHILENPAPPIADHLNTVKWNFGALPTDEEIREQGGAPIPPEVRTTFENIKRRFFPEGPESDYNFSEVAHEQFLEIFRANELLSNAQASTTTRNTQLFRDAPDWLTNLMEGEHFVDTNFDVITDRVKLICLSGEHDGATTFKARSEMSNYQSNAGVVPEFGVNFIENETVRVEEPTAVEQAEFNQQLRLYRNYLLVHEAIRVILGHVVAGTDDPLFQAVIALYQHRPDQWENILRTLSGNPIASEMPNTTEITNDTPEIVKQRQVLGALFVLFEDPTPEAIIAWLNENDVALDMQTPLEKSVGELIQGNVNETCWDRIQANNIVSAETTGSTASANLLVDHGVFATPASSDHEVSVMTEEMKRNFSSSLGNILFTSDRPASDFKHFLQRYAAAQFTHIKTSGGEDRPIRDIILEQLEIAIPQGDKRLIPYRRLTNMAFPEPSSMPQPDRTISS